MTEVDRLREELEDLNRVIGTFGGLGDLDDWTSEWVMAQSLLTRQSTLLHRIDVLTGEFEFEVSLTGEPVVAGAVDAGFAGDFLSRLQSTLASVVQSLVHGGQSRRRLPADVLDASRLRLVATAPGSFRLGLQGPPRAAQDNLLDSDAALPPFDEAVGLVMDVFDTAEADIPGEQLTDAIAALGSHQAVRRLVELSRLLGFWNTAATTVARSHFLPEVRESRWTPAAAKRLSVTLSRVEQVTETVFASGRLSGVRWANNTFDLEISDPEPRIISGKIVRDIRDSVRNVFDTDNVSVTLDKITTHTPVEVEDRVTYRLVAIRGTGS